jgi:hypothetical protein
MIREFSMVRVKQSGQLGFVDDFDDEVCGDLDDLSCVRSVALFEASKPRDEWIRADLFVDNLQEVVEAEPADCESTCLGSTTIFIESHWTEDTPLEYWYAVWIAVEDGEAHAWFERGHRGPVEEVVAMSPAETMALREAFQESEICKWKRLYTYKDLRIGSNAWRITFIRDGLKVTRFGDDAYHVNLKGLCEKLRNLGLPIAFWEGHGLICSLKRKRKRKRRGNR